MTTTDTTANTQSGETINLIVEFTGGLELLFEKSKYIIDVPARTHADEPATVKQLIPWLCENLMVDSRRELFVLDGSIRPGILVLINDADWELEGEELYELKEGDNILFVSTLHGG